MAFPAFLKKGKDKGKKAPPKKGAPPQFKKKSTGSQAMALEEAGEPPMSPMGPPKGGFPFKK